MPNQQQKSINEEDMSSMSSVTGYWKQRTSTEKILFALLLSLFIGSTITITILVTSYLRLENRLSAVHGRAFVTDNLGGDSLVTISANTSQNQEVCLSVECIEVASRILTSIDESVDPCDDMARFACGGWSSKMVNTPNSKEMVMVLENMQMRIDHRLKLALQNPPDPSDFDGYIKIRKYFSSCMEENQDESRLTSVGRIVQQLGQLIPLSAMNNTKPEGLDLTELLKQIIEHNGAPLFDVAIQVDDRNTSRYVLSIGLPRHSGIMPQFYSNMPKDLLDLANSKTNFQKSSVNSNEDHSRTKRQNRKIFDDLIDETGEIPFIDDPMFVTPDALGFFQGNGSFLTSIQQMSREQKTMATFRVLRDVGAFKSFSDEEYMADEASLKQWIHLIDSLTPSDREKKLRLQSARILNYFTVDELQKRFNFINWTSIIQHSIGENVNFDDIVVHYPEVLEKIDDLIKNTTEKRTVHNALILLTVRDLLLELFKPPPGIEKWQFCIQAVKGGFGEVLSSIYLQQFTQHQLDNYKIKAKEMFEALKETIVDTIRESDWLDTISRQNAVRKAKNLRSNLVSPDIYFNETFLEDLVPSVEIDEKHDFVITTWHMFRFFRRNFFKIFGKPVDQVTVTWQMLAYPIIANAFYLQHFNSMVLPLALLDDPLFSMETPRYLAMGTLGFIMAHEIMHGFDNSGVETDENGIRNSILSTSSHQIFQEKMNCVTSQYSETFQTQFTHNGTSFVMHVDGALTLNENVADLGAIKAIVKTHEKWMREKPRAANLPGIKYNQEQVMLIHAAQAYCAVINPQAYALILGMDEHAPPHDRVNGFMMNSPDYGRIFNCPVGSRLNPATKCTVW